MSKRTSRRTALAAAMAVGLLMAVGVHAQPAGPDARWYAWIGCWQPVGAEVAATAAEGVPTVCVLPAARGGAGVEVASILEGEVVEREPLDATGATVASEREGCTGAISGDWSADGQRVFRHSVYTCPGGLERRVDGIMALSPLGEWLDVQHLTAGGEGGVRVVRYRSVDRPAGVPAEILAAVDGRTMAAATARAAASTAVSADDVVEASQRLDSPAVEAWLLERGQGFGLELDADRLVRMADAGVPGGVIDMMVALSYPERFAINRGSGDAARRENEPTRVVRPLYGGWTSWGSGWGGFNPGYGYGSGYGYGYGYPYGGYYGRPIIVERGRDDDGSGEGRVVRGRGYTRGRGDGGSTAEPASRPSDDRGYSRPSSGGSSGSGRTAKPRS